MYFSRCEREALRRDRRPGCVATQMLVPLDARWDRGAT